MKEDQIIIRCLNCGIKNRIPSGRLQERPTCGKCHAPLDDMIIRCLSCGTKNRMPEDRLNDRPICGRCGATLVVKNDTIHPIDISDENFAHEVLLTSGPVLLDCWAPWCAPCRTLSPILDELAVKYAGGVKIAKLNVDENTMISSQYDIRSIPTMLLFKNGKLVNKLTGAMPKEEIEKHLLSIMKTN